MPDETWQWSVENQVAWNLNWATNSFELKPQSAPLSFFTLLAGGIANSIFAAILAWPNSLLEEVQAFFNRTDMRGRFWSI